MLDRDDGVLTREALLRRLTRGVVQNALQAGHLCRLHPRVYVDPDRRREPRVRWRAALAHGGPGTALCGRTALAAWGLTEPDEVTHLLTPAFSWQRGGPSLVVHRREVVEACDRAGLRLTRLEESVVDSVRQLEPGNRRAPFIEAVARRLTTPQRLRAAVDASPNVPDRRMLLRLTSLLALGCRSELELWGYDEVFRGPGMPRFRRQHPVRLGGRTVYLDMYAERERLDVELDGSGYHSSELDRERDLRRDSALAGLGIMVVRFTRRRLTTEPEAVRRDVLAILASRRQGMR